MIICQPCCGFHWHQRHCVAHFKRSFSSGGARTGGLGMVPGMSWQACTPRCLSSRIHCPNPTCLFVRVFLRKFRHPLDEEFHSQENLWCSGSRAYVRVLLMTWRLGNPCLQVFIYLGFKEKAGTLKFFTFLFIWPCSAYSTCTCT